MHVRTCVCMWVCIHCMMWGNFCTLALCNVCVYYKHCIYTESKYILWAAVVRLIRRAKQAPHGWYICDLLYILYGTYVGVCCELGWSYCTILVDADNLFCTELVHAPVCLCFQHWGIATVIFNDLMANCKVQWSTQWGIVAFSTLMELF